jgi:PAS domain S-box-containing protein
MSQSFFFDEAQFNRLFPFYMLINEELKIRSMGQSIEKLCALNKEDDFNNHFFIPRPYTPINSFNDLLLLQNQLIVLESTHTHDKKLRGQFEYLANSNEILFIGSPWFGSMEQVRENNLQINDFAHHDPLIDLLHVLKAQEINNEDLKKLVVTVNKQKEDLKKATQEVHDIALFPMQNPDPLIRINFQGDVLLNNPAAALLDFFEYEGKMLRNDVFFKIIADKIDKNNQRWTTEAISGDKVYSLLCVTMVDEGYINIYGRDITEKKKTENKLARLSLVASANKNGVLFTNPSGYITWANEGFCQLTGYSLDELIGKSPVELCKGPLTDEKTLSELLDAFFKGEGFNTDIIYYKKNKSWFWGHSFSQPLRNEHGVIKEFFGIIQDITEEKANEEKMRVLSQIAEDNINAVIIADKEGRITWANKSFTKMTGYAVTEVVGKKPGHFLQGQESDSETIKYLSNQIKNGEPFNAEILNYQKSGKKYWLRIQGQPIKNEKGEVTGFFALEEDITKEKESERRFRKALESIGDNVWEWDFQTNAIYFSKSDNQFLGFAINDKPNSQQLWWSSVYKEDLYLLEESNKKYKTGEAESHSLEYRIVDKDGSIKWVLDRGVVIERDFNGKPLRIAGTHTDITGIKHIEAELANRVKQFQSLSENIPGVIYEFEFKNDGTDGLRYISPAVEKIFGIEPCNFKNYLSYIYPDDRAMILEKNTHSRKTLEPFYVEARLQVPGKPIKWHSVHSSFSYETEQGDIVFTGFMLDITERKYAEQKLEEQRKFYEDILNNVPADIAVFSDKHEYLFVNPRGIKDTELRKWIIGKRDEDYCNFRNKPLTIADARRKTFNKVVAAKQPSEWEEKNITKDGNEEYVLRRWYPVVDESQNIKLVIGYGIDITERKKFEVALKANEEKYRGIIANMNLGLMEIDKQGKIHFANQTLLKMTGLSEQEVIGYNSMNFLDTDSIKEVEQRMTKRANGISEAYEVQTNIAKRKGWWFVSSAPKYASNGEHVGSIVICLDIAKQKHLERELIKSRERAEQLAMTKEMFLANMSHEIRTPMNAIVGMAGQLNKTNLNKEQLYYLDAIRAASDNLLVIINDILDLSKIEAGRLTLENIGFAPREVIGRIMQVMNHKAKEKGLAFVNSFCDSRLSPVLIGDPYRLNQIMLNLVSNAIKFTEKGIVDITCEVLEDTDKHQVIKAAVIDTGIGMDESFVKNLFQKFSQEDESVTRKFGGTGLGMSICKELIDLMKGSIQVKSKKGEGTTISITVSFEKGTQANLPQKFAASADSSLINGKVILVADDNKMNRMVASAILKNYGAYIIMASNGKEAVECIQQNQLDLVLMDVQMPEMDGLEATSLLRREGYHELPIIALTAFAIKGDNEKCLEAGMNDYLSKPFEEMQLVNIVSNWLIQKEKKKEMVDISQTSDQNKPIEEHNLFSLTKVQELSHGDELFVAEMVTIFMEQAAWAIEQFEKGFAENNRTQLKQTAHRIKPSIKTMQISSIEDDVVFVEVNAESFQDTQPLKNQVQKINAVLKQVIQQLSIIAKHK